MGSDYLFGAAACVLAASIAHKLYRESKLIVPHDSVTVLYSPHRCFVKRVVRGGESGPEPVTVHVIPKIQEAFTLPYEAISPTRGLVVDCIVEQVSVHGQLLDFTLSINYYIDSREFGRYLTMNGPHPPFASVTKSAAKVVRRVAAGHSPEVLLDGLKRQHLFDSLFIAELGPQLIVDACVQLIRVDIKVDLSATHQTGVLSASDPRSEA